MKFSVLVFFFLTSLYGFSQSVKITVRHHDSSEPVAGATVLLRASGQADRTGITDSAGVANFSGLSLVVYKVEITHVGFETFHGSVRPEEGRLAELVAEMEESHEEEEEVLIQSTRSTRSISDIPTRVEFIAGEELDEKSNMKPGDIRMVLNESTGIQTQQTSATSANSSIRIQGLDGRYTQILKDGFPVYAGMASGLGLLQTPPLDLQQIEVIKGSASTLYGGGAIAGLVNLISKRPREERELKFHIDLTSAGGINTSAFYG